MLDDFMSTPLDSTFLVCESRNVEVEPLTHTSNTKNLEIYSYCTSMEFSFASDSALLRAASHPATV